MIHVLDEDNFNYKYVEDIKVKGEEVVKRKQSDFVNFSNKTTNNNNDDDGRLWQAGIIKT